ncbi:MAG: hypothetical protein ACHQ2F_08195 [Desulfobaccales bacterium]
MPVWRYDLISNGEGPGGLRRNLRQAGPAPRGEAGKAQAWQVEGISGFELSERLRQQGERFRWLMENGEVLESFPASRCTPRLWKAGGDHARSTASGDGAIAALAVARYLEERKRG